MKISRLFLQSGNDYKVCSFGEREYSIRHPRIREIMELELKGNGKYFEYLYTLVSTSLDVADVLFCEAGIWYEDIKNEWDFFLQKVPVRENTSKKISFDIKSGNNIIEMYIDATPIDSIYRDALNFFFKTSGEYVLWKTDMSKNDSSDIYIVNVPFKETKNGIDIYTYDESSFKLTPHLYNIMLKYLKKMNWIKTDYKFLKGGSKGAKKYILKNDYKKRMRDKERNAEPLIDLSSIISSIIAKGQRYSDVLEYPVYLVYETYHRMIKINEWDNTMQALYGGNIDTKKNPINWDKIVPYVTKVA